MSRIITQTYAILLNELNQLTNYKLRTLIIFISSFTIAFFISKASVYFNKRNNAPFISNLIISSFVTDRVIQTLVLERKLAFRETFRFMGLSRFAYISGKLLLHFGISFTLFLLTTIATFLADRNSSMVNFINQPHTSFHFAICSCCFFFANISFSFFISKLLRNPQTCKDILGLLLLLLTFAPVMALGDKKNWVFTVLRIVPHFAYLGDQDLNSGADVSPRSYAFGILMFIEAFFYLFFYLLLDIGPLWHFLSLRRRSSIRDSDIQEDLIEFNSLNTAEPNLLNIFSLTKTYNKFCALKNIDLSFYSNRITCMVGHNGAGKTTLLNTICGMQRPSSGRILFKDQNINTTGILKGKVGYCNWKDPLYPEMTVYNFLKFVCVLKSISNKSDAIKTITELCELSDLLPKQILNLSGGAKRRLSLATAVIGFPQLIVLDEPTSGMDLENRRKIWQVLERLKSPDRIIIFTTQDMEEASFLSEDIIILSKGEVQFRGASEDIMRDFEVGYSIVVRVSTEKKLESLIKAIFRISDLIEFSKEDFLQTGLVKIKIGINEKGLTGIIISLLEEREIPFQLNPSSLEDAFVALEEKEGEVQDERRKRLLSSLFVTRYTAMPLNIFLALFYRKLALFTSNFYQVLVYFTLIFIPGFLLEGLCKLGLFEEKTPFGIIGAVVPAIAVCFVMSCSFYADLPIRERETQMRYLFLLLDFF